MWTWQQTLHGPRALRPDEAQEEAKRGERDEELDFWVELAQPLDHVHVRRRHLLRRTTGAHFARV
jgi:hypothetical protein